MTFGQELLSPIQNYNAVAYGAASQNWDIAIDSTGIIYTANHEGLLSFDGLQWELHELKSRSTIRSVYTLGKRIYTGSYKEFGYWERDLKGDLCYTSLTPLLNDHDMQNEEIWDILSFKGSIYFRSFGAIYKYDHHTIVPLANVITNAMVVLGDQLIVAVGQEGIFILDENGKLTPLPNQEMLAGQTVIDLAVDGYGLVAGTTSAIYTYSSNKLSQFKDKKLNNLLEQFELNHILKISDSELVLGTVKNGLIHYNYLTGKSKIYNRKSGLQNNTILGMAAGNGKIWLGLDNGVDVINLKSPIDFYTDDTGELGAVYDITYYKSKLYLASNTGVYELSVNGLELIEGAEGHSWNLKVIDDILYSNHNKGTYKIINNKFIPVERRTGSFDILKIPGDQKSILIGNYTGISIYDPQTDLVKELEDINFPVKKVIFESPNVIWALHPYEGVFRIGLNHRNYKSRFIEKGKNDEGFNGKTDLFTINNRIAVSKENTWFEYNPLRDSLVIFKELERFNDHKLLLEDGSKYWFMNMNTNALVLTDFKTKRISLAFWELNKRLVKGNENLIKLNDSIFYITLNDGFGRINVNVLSQVKKNENLSTPQIFKISDADGSYDLSKFIEIPYHKARAVKIKVGLPNSDPGTLQYNLIGKSSQEGSADQGMITFQNLSYGKYELELFALSSQQTASKITYLTFEVLPPWYLSNLMKFFYVFMAIGLIGIIYWVNQLKLKKHQMLLEQKFQKDHEERINKLEKERLINEITSKRKELANTTMMGARKNEVLMEIHGELNKDKDKFSNQFRLKHIMNKINGAIKNKDEWKLFETNFNELHEDFSKDLLKTYPKLSNKDLKLCSYLKMNLSSKEIAPLMGISVRGVEVHRYRLRKKMELDSNENLTSFLIKEF